MKSTRFLVFGGLLAASLAAMVAGVAASLDSAVTDQAVRDKFSDEAPVITQVSAGQAVTVQSAPGPSADRRMMFLDGRGSHLGVMVQDSEAGVRIDQVDRESPAEKAGLREGDIVVEFDGERVRSARQFTRLVQETPEGRTVRIGILRGGQKQTVDATPQASSFGWSMNFDGDRIRREFERGMRGLDELRLMEPRGFAFRYDDLLPGRTSRGRLGVTVESLTPQLQEYFGAKDGGALVSSVTAGSPAEKAGLKAGDVITTINGDRVQDAGDVIDELNQGTTTEVTIGIVRDRKASTLKATIEPRSQVRPRQPAAFVRPA
jgi:S1-C subfamily serine protease